MRPVNIIKVKHEDQIGFDLHQVPYPTTISVNAATETDPPYILVKEYGDFRGCSIPVTGDVTIMNSDGVVLAEESYGRLTAKTLKVGRNPDGTWGKIDLLKSVTEFPSSIQGSKPRQAFNTTSEDAHFDKGYSYDLFAELFGTALPVVEMALAMYHRKHHRTKYKIYHRAVPTESGVIGYLEADKQMIFAIFATEARDLVGLGHSYLASHGLIKSGSGRTMLQSGEGITVFTTPRCGNGFTPLKTDLDPDDYAGPTIDPYPTAVETRYTEPNSGIRFIPSPGYDAMDEAIKRGHASSFAMMFQCLSDFQPNGTWYLYLNDLSRDKDEVLGIMEACGRPHLIVLKDKILPVDDLTASEKERYGLKYTQDVGWKIKDFSGRQMFNIVLNLHGGRIWDIKIPTVR